MDDAGNTMACMTMMLQTISRVLAITTAVILAAVVDLALPIWTAGVAFPVTGAERSAYCGPSLLDLAFVLLCQSHGAAGAVFWGGAAGLLGDVVRLQAPGTGMMLQATLAWIWVLVREDSPGFPRKPKLFPSLVLLGSLGLARMLMQSLMGVSITPGAMQFTAVQLAVTFVPILIACQARALLSRPPAW